MKSLTSNRMRVLRSVTIAHPGISIGIGLLLAMAALIAASLLVAPPIALSAERYTVAGSQVTIYDLAGELEVEPYLGSDVIVEVSREGRDAAKLRVESGPAGVRNTPR